MLHYQTSSGVTGACKIYTTLDECPYPNLKVQVDGTTGYIKLSADSSDPNKTPIKVYVPSNGKTYSALKDVVPTGSVHMNENSTITVTVPAAVKVLQFVTDRDNHSFTLGVTPGSTHAFHCSSRHTSSWYTTVTCETHSTWSKSYAALKTGFTIKWSPEINKMSLNATDY